MHLLTKRGKKLKTMIWQWKLWSMNDVGISDSYPPLRLPSTMLADEEYRGFNRNYNKI